MHIIHAMAQVRAPAEDIATTIIEATSRYFRAVITRLPTHAPGLGGVTREQWSVLLEVSKAGPDGLTMGELAGRLGMALNSATALVDRLVTAAHLERRSDPADRRIVRVGVTAAGSSLTVAIKAARRAEYDRLLAELTPEQLEALRRAVPALDRMAEAAKR